MIEMIDKLNECKDSLQKSQPTEFIAVIKDMNIISFFSSKNITTLEKMINNSANGSYDNLKYLIMLKTDLELTMHSSGISMWEMVLKYATLYMTTLSKTNNIKTSLFLDTDSTGAIKKINDLVTAAFALMLIFKHKG
ncbi:MAG: hypothetical protein DRJ64_01610 [Thermoprotei archaeon]|nr:MAG: hypothetical protein DRJ64_01610 [Thermoprotei archaeon]